MSPCPDTRAYIELYCLALVLVPTAIMAALFLLNVCSALVESISERWGRIKTNLNL